MEMIERKRRNSRAGGILPVRAPSHWRRVSIALLLGVLSLSACVKPRSTLARVQVDQNIVKSSARFQKQYVLVPGDQIDVVVRRAPEVSRGVVVRPDGFVTLPLVNDVKAAGAAPMELASHIEELLAKRLNSPEVTVITTNVRQQVVYVTGDVNSPAAVPLSHAPTALQAIALAGGLKRSAAVRQVALIRLGADGYLSATEINVAGEGQPDPLLAFGAIGLEADDVIFVPESGRSQFARFVDDFLNRPLGTLNSIVGTYANFRLISIIAAQ
jgi:polysaccharide biosynthesis/export protein